ncbi:MAG: LuxR family transcriptional regulator [Leptolyngbyaceae cyanobacterium RM2_2_4]|nr:LuxR family transcriptional regulator [Leptolyngbyaceae cyanobacterium SM1_4_3]NJN89018.1 LuxR family transcriptional regulator [Leptolyngbyaceae cyanobacterium SL_5_14]NJO51010.1 LuxR family transcriptional regulator [Leptolyngbyaceae cyanobacterium RM2_2_4]
MTSSLKLLFEAIDQTRSEEEMRSQIAPKIGKHFAATRQGIFFFDQLPLAGRNFQKLLKAGLSVKYNPVVRYLVERHAPVHEALVATPKSWSMICPRADHWHVIAGPIVNRTQLVGAVGCTREKSKPAFDTKDLADMSAICLHLSVWVTAVRSQDISQNLVPAESYKPGSQSKAPKDCLTPRELQIVGLVALGRTNAEIGNELWITENSVKQALKRMFRKLEVSSRAEMVAQFFSNQRA